MARIDDELVQSMAMGKVFKDNVLTSLPCNALNLCKIMGDFINLKVPLILGAHHSRQRGSIHWIFTKRESIS